MTQGYRVDIASRGQAQCNGPKPCGKPNKIDKGTFRLGVFVHIPPPIDKSQWKWKHWGCVTPKVISNLKDTFDEASELDGFDELPEMYQQKIVKAFEEGHVADEDIPETARKPPPAEGEEDEGTPKKKKPAKKAKKEDGGEEDGDEKPKKGGRKRKSEAVKAEVDEDEEDEKPKKGRKSKAAKAENVSEEEDAKPKKGGKKSTSKAKLEEEDSEELSEEEVVPAKKVRKAPTAKETKGNGAGGKKRASKSAAKVEESEDEDE